MSWKQLIKESITDPAPFFDAHDPDLPGLGPVVEKYPMRINAYYRSLIKTKNDPMWKQVVPDVRELAGDKGLPDPLCEENQSPVPGLIHRYPNRVVFLVSGQCAVYCRFCMRKRKVGTQPVTDRANLADGLDYIKKTTVINEVILSGGDPLMMDDDRLEWLLKAIRSNTHVKVIRVHSRMPCALPQRITPRLVKILSDIHPVFVNTHFNHPDEVTPQAVDACTRLVDGGIPTGCQTVLLHGVNDHPAIMKELMEKLLLMRVRPYYIHQADPVCGTGHFHAPLQKGLEIMKKLRGHISGMGVPQFMVDLPGGGGKTPVLPEYVMQKEPDFWRIKNFEGKTFKYPVTGTPTGNFP